MNENPSRWSLTDRPGYLCIHAHPGSIADENLLLRDAPSGDYEISTHLIFGPFSHHQTAGIVLRHEDGSSLILARSYCDGQDDLPCLGNQIDFDGTENGAPIGGIAAITTQYKGMAYLRVTRRGSTYSGHYSDNGRDWTLVGSHTFAPGIQLSQVGLAAARDFAETGIAAYFDYFDIRALVE